MANEFIIRKGYKSLAASEVTGSLTTTGNIVGEASGYLQRLYIQDKKALDSSSNFLYIDPNTQFGSGIYINNAVRIDGGLLGSYNEDLQLRTGTTTRITIANADGAVRFHNYGAGYLKTDSSGNITVDTSTIEDTLDSVTDRGATTTNNITVGNLNATQLNLENMGNYITFYGGDETNHSITSRQLDGGTGDDIRLNTYGSFIVNLDSNNNQSSATNSSFFIGRHGGNASAISGTNLLFQIDGQSGDVLPGADSTHNLGINANRWLNVYADNLHTKDKIQNSTAAYISYISNQGHRFYVDGNNDDTSHKFEILANTTSYASANVRFSMEQTGATKFISDGSLADGATIYLKHANNNTADTIGTIFFGNNADETLSKIVSETSGANNTSNLLFGTSNAGTMATVLTLNADNTSTFANSIDLTAGQVKLRTDVALDHDGSSLYIKAPSSIYFYPGNSNKANLSTAGTLQLAGNLDVNGTGTSTIDGNLTVAGTLTAQEFHTEFVSASILYESGSTKFGDTSDDNHNFTGSINLLSGSLNITGPFSDPGTPLTLHNSINAAGVSIRFTDTQAGTSQYGRLTYRHSDSQSQGGGASFHFTAEPDTVLVVGDSTNKGRLAVYSSNNAAEVDYGFAGDTNTGLYQPAAGSLGLVRDGSRKLLVTGDGVKIQNGRFYLDGTVDTNTTSAIALVLNGTEVEKRTLGSAAFANTGDFLQQGSYSAGYTGDMNSLTGLRIIRSTSGSNRAFSAHHNVLTIPNTSASQYGAQVAFETGTVSDGGIKFRNSTNGTFTSWYRLYHEGHKPTYAELGTMAYSNLTGTPSSLPANGGNSDTVDNLHASSFLRSDANDDFSGTLNYTPDTGTILSVDGQAILQRMTANGAITIGHDDAVIIAGGDTSTVLNSNITNSNETVYIGAEGGLVVYGFPNNDTTWSNRQQFTFANDGKIKFGTASDTNLYRSAANTLKTDDAFHATGLIQTNGYFQVVSSAQLLRKYVSGWNSGVQTHDIIYNGWHTNTGDYTYVKAAGNSTGGHGIILAADNGTYLGTTDIETGAITDSATAPLTNTWAYFRDASAYIKGNASFDGSISMNQSNTQVDITGNSSGNLTIDNNTGTIAFQADGSTVQSVVISSSEVFLNEDVRIGSFGNNNAEFALGQTIANKVYNYGAEIQTQNSSIQLVLGRNNGTSVQGTGGIGADQNNAFAVWNTSSTTKKFEVTHAGNATIAGDLTVSGGDITLSGTGRIQGIDTVSANTDAANKLYVDNAIAGVGGVSAPNAPTSLTTSIVGNTINVGFTASTTSDIDLYLVFSSVSGSDYSLISVIPPDDFGSTMSIIDDSFDESGVQAYRVYAQKNGAMSSALTGNITYSVTTPLEPTNMSVVNLNTAYYVQWDPPSSNARFVTAYNVYKHEHATQSSLSRSSATLIYSGMNTSYMYQINGNNNLNFHQFWVETTVA